MMHGHGKSDSLIGPTKLPNKAAHWGCGGSGGKGTGQGEDA